MGTAVSLLALYGVSLYYVRNREKKVWNNGICAEYGEPWRQFYNSGHGSRGYRCRDKFCFVSYNVDVIMAADADK
jgi:hypothetical protein